MSDDEIDRAPAASSRAPGWLLAGAFVLVLLLVILAGRAFFAERAAVDADAAAAWAAAGGSEARIAEIVESQGCERSVAQLRRRATGVDALPTELNALGVCLARTGEIAEARRAFALAVRRGAAESDAAFLNREALDRFVVAREYVRALDLEPAPDVPQLRLRSEPAGGARSAP